MTHVGGKLLGTNVPPKVRMFSLASIIRYFANNGKIKIKESYARFDMLYVWPSRGDSDACFGGMWLGSMGVEIN